MTTPVQPVRLLCGAVTHPVTGRAVPAFDSWETALAHLCDHLLTAPESTAWALLLPGYQELVTAADADARWEYSRQAWDGAGSSAQALYDLYHQAIEADLADARRLGWQQPAGGDVVTLGTSGILAIVGVYLRTAFLPGHGDPARTHTPRTSTNTLPRESSMRPARDAAERDQAAARQRYQQRWSAAEKVYWLVFRPAVQFVRDQHVGARDLDGRPLNDYGVLKQALPPLSQLKWDSWQTLRVRCGRVSGAQS